MSAIVVVWFGRVLPTVSPGGMCSGRNNGGMDKSGHPDTRETSQNRQLAEERAVQRGEPTAEELGSPLNSVTRSPHAIFNGVFLSIPINHRISTKARFAAMQHTLADLVAGDSDLVALDPPSVSSFGKLPICLPA
ncbi:hypothetical protein PG993_011048 [Apiospora rasikravindrae]|uniref:Uncharacterized protein n=1 Tax=Apiospora rasikravindrae TaxID=990691 RepID=A0ABR1SFC5_9PEZI